MTRGPSLYAEPLLNKSPDPHSVVERLLTRAQSRCDKDRALGDSSIMTPENYLEWQAATIISKLQAEVERDKLYWNGRCVDLQVNAHGWMNAHDQLLGFIQSRPELLKALIDEKFAIKYPSPADVPEILQRALAAESSVAELQAERGSWRETFRKQNENFLHVTRLKDEYRQRALAPESEVSALKHDIERHLGIIAEQESSLSRIKEETIEACADEANGVDLEILEGKSELFVSIYCGSRVDASAAIRSLSTDDSKRPQKAITPLQR